MQSHTMLTSTTAFSTQSEGVREGEVVPVPERLGVKLGVCEFDRVGDGVVEGAMTHDPFAAISV